MTTTTETCLPAHMEIRRDQILEALRNYGNAIETAHERARLAIRDMNSEIAEFNRVLDHVDGWTIEACEVIAHMQASIGRDVAALKKWRTEIDNSVFLRLDPVTYIPAPVMPHAEEFEALPRYPDRDNG